jgi:predicted DNA-binding transcriptional regulator AlpA
MPHREIVSDARDRNKPKPQPAPLLALTILQFCEAHTISEAMFYKLKKKGLAPRETKIGTRTIITLEAAADWRAEREAASANVTAPLDG